MTSFDDLRQVQEVRGADNLMLVDGLNLAFRYKHKKTRNFASDYVRTVSSLATSYLADKVIIHVDQGQSSYRKAIDPEYKGNRKEMRANQTEQDKEDFKLFFDDFNAAIDLCATLWPIVRYQGVEADDTIAYVASNTDHETWIISTDKDLDQLVNKKVNRFSYVTRKEVRDNNFFETYGCTPEEYITLKVLMGDKGDNVMGIPLVGPKRAIALLREYGSAMDLLDQVPLTGKQKFISNINEYSDRIMINYELMDLVSYQEEAIGADNLLDLQGIMGEAGV